MEGKVILLDYGYYLHASGWAYVANPQMPATFTCLSMMIGDLKKVGVEVDDTIIVAVDYHGADYSSWRKLYTKEYKEGRKKLPDELYNKFNTLLTEIDLGTSWHIVLLEHLEADDVFAVASRYYKDQEVVIISADCDMEQLWIYPTVKLFSPHRKSKRYKIPPPHFNYYNLLAKKIRKEAKDSLKSEILSAEEYDQRKLILDLVNLPEWVEEKVREKLATLKPKEFCIDDLPFQRIRERYVTIPTDKSKIVTYEKCLKRIERKKKSKKTIKK